MYVPRSSRDVPRGTLWRIVMTEAEQEALEELREKELEELGAAWFFTDENNAD